MRSSVPPWGTSLRVVGGPQTEAAVQVAVPFIPLVHAGEAGGSDAELETTPQDGTSRKVAVMELGQLEWLKGAAPATYLMRVEPM